MANRRRQSSMRCTACGQMFALKLSRHYRFPGSKHHVYWCFHCGQINGRPPNGKAALHRYAWHWFAYQVKKRAAQREQDGACVCVTCGLRMRADESNCHAGHCVPRLQGTRYYFDFRACHPQCSGCNGPGDGEQTIYAVWMIDQYGRNTLDEIVAAKRRHEPITEDELRDIIHRDEPPDAFAKLRI